MATIAPLEDQGYTLPDHMVPDISQGKMFAKWMREKFGMDTDTLPTYKNKYADGRVVDAKMYPIGCLDEFRRHFQEVWIPQKAPEYFAARDERALPFLIKVISLVISESYTLPKLTPAASPTKGDAQEAYAEVMPGRHLPEDPRVVPSCPPHNLRFGLRIVPACRLPGSSLRTPCGHDTRI